MRLGRPRWRGSSPARGRPAPLLAVASALVLLSPASLATANRVHLVPVPVDVVKACLKAEAQVRYLVLCPSRLPRASLDRTPGQVPFALAAQAFAGQLDIGYGVGDETGPAQPSGLLPALQRRPRRPGRAR